jgi:hypothetical protein
MFTVAELAFVTVTTLGGLAAPTARLPKFSEVGEKVKIAPLAPVPNKPVTRGLKPALCCTVKPPLMLPLDVGLNVTEIVHIPCATRVLPQPLVPPGAAV